MVLNPSTESKLNRGRALYVCDRIEWYCEFSEPLKNNDLDRVSFAGIEAELRKRVINLYQELLLYMMKSVYLSYKEQFLTFLRDIIKLDDWDCSLKKVKDAKNAFRNDTGVLNILEIKSTLVHITKNQEKFLSTWEMTVVI